MNGQEIDYLQKALDTLNLSFHDSENTLNEYEFLREVEDQIQTLNEATHQMEELKRLQFDLSESIITQKRRLEELEMVKRQIEVEKMKWLNRDRNLDIR